MFEVVQSTELITVIDLNSNDHDVFLVLRRPPGRTETEETVVLLTASVSLPSSFHPGELLGRGLPFDTDMLRER